MTKAAHMANRILASTGTRERRRSPFSDRLVFMVPRFSAAV
jgi:hypothetical protein